MLVLYSEYFMFCIFLLLVTINGVWELRDNLEFLTFLKKCFDIIFSHLHRTPEDNPKNGANLLHYFIMIPFYPLCESVLAHSPELIHRQELYG